MGGTQEPVLHDILDQYEKHIHFCTATRGKRVPE